MVDISRLPTPVGRTKDEIVDILLREEYGYLPPRPYAVEAALINIDKRFCAGKAELLTLELTCKAEFGEFTFPIYYSRPLGIEKVPCFIHINFRSLIPDKFQPTEELVDNGIATLTFGYKDVTSDDGDFSNRLAGVVYKDKKRAPDACGKIGLWTWAAMAVMDYAETLPELDKDRICVVGHSRLGKTALLAGALDERFFCAFSNDSGCSGAALSRENTGESIKAITNRFPYWFCENYYKYAENEDMLPFDQHWLIAANSPHRVYVASAEDDGWACPENEYRACIAASEYYKTRGMRGFAYSNETPEVGVQLADGEIGYHLRRGLHYLGREDWNYYIKYLNS